MALVLPLKNHSLLLILSRSNADYDILKAAVIGITGGLAAPLVAGGIATVMGGLGLGTTAAAGLLGTLAESGVIVGSLFGAYGGRMTSKMVRDFAFDLGLQQSRALMTSAKNPC